MAANIVLPIALLNSALAFAVLAIIFKQKRILFAILAFVGGSYMLLDILNGWFSANFVDKVVKNPIWISAFVYLNAVAIGFCVWLLIQPLWSKANLIGSTKKRNGIIIKVSLILLIAVIASAVPIIYHSVQNRFVPRTMKFNFFERTNKKSPRNASQTNFVAIINTEALRGRTEPDMNVENVIFRLEKGMVLDVLDEKATPDGEIWYQVQYGTKAGWILSTYATKNERSEQWKSTDNDVQFKKMQFVSYGCGDNCYLNLKDLQTNQDESFMFWSKFGILSELGWDEDGNIQKKFQGNIYEVTLNKKYMEWSTLIGNETVKNKEVVWYVVEMLPLNK